MDKYKYNNNNNNKGYLRNVYCVNCGEKGHVLKQCTGPITSFGIIAFKNCNNEDDTKFDTNDFLNHILDKLNINFDKMYKLNRKLI